MRVLRRSGFHSESTMKTGSFRQIWERVVAKKHSSAQELVFARALGLQLF